MCRSVDPPFMECYNARVNNFRSTNVPKKSVKDVAKLFLDFITVVGNFKYTKSILLGGYRLSKTLTFITKKKLNSMV
jgi:hypothetical protein